MTPWYFQTEAKNSVFGYFNSGMKGNPLVCMPTGTGKSLVIADILKDIFNQFPNQRVMMLTHVWKLILQNAEKLQKFWPTAPIGIHSAQLGARDTIMPIIFGGIQSVVKNVESFGHRDLIFIDEAHLLGADEDSQYLDTIKRLTAINPYLKVVGLTATPYRLKMGTLLDGGLFSDICYDITTHTWFRRLINEGYLCPLIGKPTATKIDGIGNLSIQAGDFNQKQAEALIDKDEITYAACKEFMEYSGGRQKAMIFAAGIKNAEHIASMLQSFGVSATCIHSKLPAGVQTARLQAYDNDDIWCMVGANQLTTGYDNRKIDLIGDFQPTCSPGKHVQKLGRGTRVYGNMIGDSYTKENCLYLDFVGNVGRNGPIDDPVMPRKPGQKTGDVPVKICTTDKLVQIDPKHPNAIGCDAYNHASARHCCNCAGEFSFQTKLNDTAYNVAPMKQDVNPVFNTVKIVPPVYYKRHEGKSKAAGIIGPPSVKATYMLGMRAVNVFLCFEHTGKPRRIAHEWWMKHASSEPPKTVDEFLARVNELRIPKQVMVHSNLPYPEITSYEF